MKIKYSFTSKYIYENGFTLVEIVLGIGILTIFMVSNAYYYRKMLDVSQQTTRYIQSGFLLEEGIEAVKLLRDESWTANIAPLTSGTNYYLYWNGTKWEATTTEQIIENVFSRSFTVATVERDGNDSIVPSGGAVDVGTKKVVLTASWMQRGSLATSSQSIETYITDLFSN